MLESLPGSLRACNAATWPHHALASALASWHLPAMARILAVAGQKGGAGKSTVAINVASELHARGARVLLVDADHQGTAVTWAGIATEAGADEPVTVAMGDNLRAQLPTMAAPYDWAVIDCPGRGGKRQIAAMAIADLVLLPCGPSPADAWALAETVEELGRVQELRPELRAFILANRVDRTAIGASSREAVASLGLPLMRSTLGDRAAFREAIATGQGITSYATGAVAANELRRLVDEIEEEAEKAR